MYKTPVHLKELRICGVHTTAMLVADYGMVC